jgi:hypothetical protein
MHPAATRTGRGCIHGEGPPHWRQIAGSIGAAPWIHPHRNYQNAHPSYTLSVDISTPGFSFHPLCDIRGRELSGGGIPLGSETIAGYWRISDALRHVQRTAIEVENAPDKRKRLRCFTVAEIAELLAIDRLEFLAACGQSEHGRFQPRTLLSFLDVEAARNALAKSRSDIRFRPRRDAKKGEAIAIVAFANFLRVDRERRQVQSTLHSTLRSAGIGFWLST